MPGTYAHITIANALSGALEKAGAPAPVLAALGRHLKYCELGAVSPDYPYLVLADPNARWWADKMHRGETGRLLAAGVDEVRALPAETKPKVLAWLLGFASHVMADMTVHPIVELVVGKYEGHETAHRLCEMHQDVFIFAKVMNLRLRFAERFKQGIATCGAQHQLDADVAAVWRRMLQRVYPDDYRRNAPNLDLWHSATRVAIDGIAVGGDRLVPLARHVAVDLGLVYPRETEVDPRYLERLATPAGPMSYRDVFARAVTNVASQGTQIAQAVLDPSSSAPRYAAAPGEWDLDTGRIDGGRRIFWEGVA